MEVKLYVGNLPYSTTENDLRRLFAQAGTVTDVNLMKDRGSGRSKGFAFVTMATQAEAQKAIGQLHAFALAQRQLTVKIAEKHEAPSVSLYRSRLGAFGGGESTPKTNSRTPGAPRGGYQSSLGAFGKGGNPPPLRRRGGKRGG